MSEYFELCNERSSGVKANLKRTISMINAVKLSDDCRFIDLVIRKLNNSTQEIVICEISNDEVPSRNQFGIKYCERIAYVFSKEMKLPETLALRKSFPTTMHQNSSLSGAPKSLCLYEEEENTTLANWTPERHIRRTKWWLIQASIGKLHADNQAVEQLLYNPHITFVVPNHLEHGLKKGKKLFAYSIKNDNDDEKKLFIEAKWQSHSYNQTAKIEILDIRTQEITHGIIYSPPTKYSDLVALMTDLNIDFVDVLRETLLSKLKNKQIISYDSKTVIMLSLPIRRNTNSTFEKEQIIALYCDKNIQQLLWDFEIKLKENGLTNVNKNGDLFPLSNKSLDFDIVPMEVLQKPNDSVRRAQSGNIKPIGKATLVGAGSLGGCLHDIWSRSGWGVWTIIDNDYFRPHNFTRHIASANSLGYNKALVVAANARANFEDQVNTISIADNACNLSNKEIRTALSSAELVVDASASLEYPRHASTCKLSPRHISAFFTPNGNNAVLLVEDRRLKTRLNSLEAQYYRALIATPVGEKHLTTLPHSFRSGASCRDISVTMSFARVLSLSSLLADQIRLSSEQDNAQICIWQDDVKTGERTLANIRAYKTKSNKNHIGGGFKIFWDEGLEKKVSDLRQAALPNETGGILVGYYDMVRNFVFIVDALPAPSDSEGTPSSFVRGKEGVNHSLELIHTRTANIVSYIGEWHSHPNGTTASMSKLDRTQLAEIACNLAKDGLPAYQMIVAQNEIRVYGKKHEIE